MARKYIEPDYLYTPDGRRVKNPDKKKSNNVMDNRRNFASDMIAPIRTTSSAKKKEEEESDIDFFRSGAFGIKDKNAVEKSVLGIGGTLLDATAKVARGVLEPVEGVADWMRHGVADTLDFFGADETAKTWRDVANKSDMDSLFGWTDDYFERNSMLGKTSQGIAQGVGQVGAMALTSGAGQAIGLGAKGITALTTGFTGLSSMGSGRSEAYLQGATDEESRIYGAIKGVADAGTELLFGGMGKSINALGYGKGISSADDMLAKKLSTKLTDILAKNIKISDNALTIAGNTVELGVKSSAEGVEEVLAGFITAVGKKATYMSEEEFDKILEDENLLEQFVVGSLTSGIVQSGVIPKTRQGSFIEANQKGVDLITGYTRSEQELSDKIVEKQIAEAEKDGKKISEKDKNSIKEQVQTMFERGELDIDTIEEHFGGDEYKVFQSLVKEAEEYDTLNKTKGGELTGEQSDRLAELKAKNTEKSYSNQLLEARGKLSETVRKNTANNSFIQKSFAELGKRRESYKVDATKKYSAKEMETVQRAVDYGALNNTRRTHEFVDLVAKLSADKGVSFDFTNNQKLKDSGFAIEGKTINGFKQGNNIVINMQSKNNFNTVVGHEITHVLEGTELYQSLQDTVIQYAKDIGVYDAKYKDIDHLYRKQFEGNSTVDRKALYDSEITADLVGEYIFSDVDFVRNLSTKNRNVFEKVYDEIKYFLKVVTTGSDAEKQLLKAKKIFEDVYRDTKKNTSENTQLSVADNKGRTLTKEQQEKFKDSVVRDENGNLKTLYHGSESMAFTEFNIENGVWLSETQSYSEVYAGQWHSWRDDYDDAPTRKDINGLEKEVYSDEDLRIYELYADIKNPLDIGEINGTLSDGKVSELANKLGHYIADKTGDMKQGGKVAREVRQLAKDYIGEKTYNFTRTKEFLNYAKELGFDGFEATENGKKTYCVFNSADQVKLVTNKKPTSNQDIRFSLSTEYDLNPKPKPSLDPTSAQLQKDERSVRDIRNETMLKNDYTLEQVEQTNKFFDEMGEFMKKAGMEYKYIGLEDVNNAKLKITYDKNGNPQKIVLSAMVKNGDYPVNFDFTSICKKRQSISLVVKELAKRQTDGKRTLDVVNMSPESLWKINEELRKAGLETACLGCFVESKRYNIQNFAKKATRMWNNTVNEIRKEQGIEGNVEYFNFAEGIDLDSVDYSEVDKIFKEYATVKGRTSPAKRMRALIQSGGAMYQKYLQPSDLMTPEGIEAIKSLSSKKNNFYGILQGVYGQASPKEVMGFSPYNSEIALLPDKKWRSSMNDYIKSIGGVRMQSFSDFLVANVYDYMQMVGDLSARHLPAHAYTKELAFAKIFGMTGIKINMSVMFDIDSNLPDEYAGLTFVEGAEGDAEYNGVRGRFEYIIADQKRSDAEFEKTGHRPYVQSIPYDEAVALQNDPRYSKNVGIIGVGYSDNHIMKMLGDDDIRYVIPYHASSLPAIIKDATKIRKATDYTDYQTIRKLDSIVDGNGNVIDFNAFKNQFETVADAYGRLQELVQNEGWQVNTSGQGKSKFNLYKDIEKTQDPKRTAENYLNYCAKNNLVPVFEKFAGHENYYKLLFDFDPYDSVTGEYAPQTEVSNIYDGYNASEGEFSTEAIQEMIDDEMFIQNEKNRERNEKIPSVVDSVLDQLGMNEDEQFSIADEQEEAPRRIDGIYAEDVAIDESTDYYSDQFRDATKKVENVAPIKENLQNNEDNLQDDEEETKISPTNSNLEELQPKDEKVEIEKKVQRINKRFEHDKEVLQEDYNQRKAEALAEVADKGAFISNRALELYNELNGLKKGVRASKELGYLLDFSESWKDLKIALVNIKAKPIVEQNVNANSATETIVREAIGREYDSKVNDAEFGLENEYQNELKELEKSRYERISIAEKRASKQTIQKELREWASALMGDTTHWVDKKLGIQYATNTLRRNLRDIVRDKNGQVDIKRADAIYDALAGEYNRNHAKLNKESNQIKKEFADMKINKRESVYIQMLGELRHNPETELTKDAVDEYYNKYKDKIDTHKVDRAIDRARVLYDELFVRVNDSLRANGMKEIEYRKGYFPHFTKPKQGIIAKALNWKTQDFKIPTSIAGITDMFKPQRTWQSFSEHRNGDTTDYDFLEGLDTYVAGALDWIYHIEDIQKRRAFETEIRYRHSDKGIQEAIDAILEDENKTFEEKQILIDEKLREADNPLGNFVTDFMNATNTLANKKSASDRGMEQLTNRQVYSTMTNISNRVTANMVVGSVSSAMTNIIPITQSWSQVSPITSLVAMRDTIKNSIKDDGVIEKSVFLTNRLNEAEKLSKSGWDKAGEKLAFMMNVMDSFTSQVVWRSKYAENISKGMSEVSAIDNADLFAEGLMAGRSKGNMPTIFDSKNPIIKTFTAFQLEVANQYGYMFKDMPVDMKKEGLGKLTKGYATMFIGAFMYNALSSAITGRDSAFDPLGILNDFLKDLFGDDDEEKEPLEAIGGLAKNVVEEIPFVGGLMGGGRIPIASALPYDDPIKMVTGTAQDFVNKDWKSLLDEWSNPLYYGLLPMGGGQLRKTIQGLSMFSDEHPVSGSYTQSGDLRYPVEDTFLNKLQAGVFGQYANENARTYFDEGRKPLKEKQIQEYKDLDMPIKDYWEYRDGLKEQKTVEDKFEYIANLDLPVAKKNIMINNELSERKQKIDLTNYNDFADYDEFDWYSKNTEKYNFLEENGVSYAEYKKADEDLKDQYDNDYEWYKNNPNKVTFSKAITNNAIEYRDYMRALDDISADKDKNGKSISGSRKTKVINYVNSLNLSIPQKAMLIRQEYSTFKEYNNQIIDYVSGLDISYEDKVTILEELEMKVDANGNVTW